MNGRLVTPLGVEIKLTDKCNSRCIHCIADCTSRGNSEIDASRLEFIAKEIKSAGVFYVGLTGGEPLLYPDFFKFVALLKQSGLRVGVTTNALLINDEIASMLKNYGIDLVRISLDGSCPEINDFFRGVRGHFEKVKNATRLLKEVGINPIILSVISKYNADDLENLINTAIVMGVPAINCYTLVPGGRGRELKKYIFSPEEYRDFLRKIIFLKEKYMSKIKIITETPLMNILRHDSDHICLAGRAQLFIKEDGDVVPCPYMDDYILGNIFTDTIKKMWGGKKLSNLISRSRLDPCCKRCRYVDGCFGGCRAASYAKYNRLDIKDPFCFMEGE